MNKYVRYFLTGVLSLFIYLGVFTFMVIEMPMVIRGMIMLIGVGIALFIIFGFGYIIASIIEDFNN